MSTSASSKWVKTHEDASKQLLGTLAELGVDESCTAIVMDFDLVDELESDDLHRGRGHLSVRTLVIRRGRMLTNTF